MVDKQTILDSVGPVQAVLDAHDGVVFADFQTIHLGSARFGAVLGRFDAAVQRCQKMGGAR